MAAFGAAKYSELIFERELPDGQPAGIQATLSSVPPRGNCSKLSTLLVSQAVHALS